MKKTLYTIACILGALMAASESSTFFTNFLGLAMFAFSADKLGLFGQKKEAKKTLRDRLRDLTTSPKRSNYISTEILLPNF